MNQPRDFSELSMISISRWHNDELRHFQHVFSQILPYVNSEGLSILHEINHEMQRRSADSPDSPLH